MSYKPVNTVWTCLAVLFLSSFVSASIDRGVVSGAVTDPQGSVVPGATVEVKNVDTNVVLKLVTNTAGFYSAGELIPGKYSVRVSAPGFSVAEISNVTVSANTTSTANAELKVGSTTQTVQVVAGAALVDTTPSDFSTGVSASSIAEIPLGGRDVQALVQLVPGVTQSSGPSGALFGFNSQFGGFPDPLHFAGSNLSSNGSQGGANAWYLDGSLNQSVMTQNVVINPSPDAITEFNVIDNGLSAEWGRTNGAVFNVVLKSGANRLHGDLYAFNRNSAFSATNPFARRDANGVPLLQPSVNWNDLGGTLGGPVYIPHVYNGKNRTFFFVSYDLSFLHERKPTLLTVPLPNERSGDFTGDPRFAAQCDPANGVTNCLYNSNSTTGPDVNGLFHRTPFSTPVIPPGLIDPVAAFYAASYPNPNFLDPLQQGSGGCGNLCSNYIGPVGSSLTTHNFSIKIDHTLTDKHKLFAEWLFNPGYYTNFRYPWNGPTAATQTGVEGAQPYYVHPQIASVGLTSTFTPTLVNEARVVFNRQVENASPNPENVTANSQVEQKVQGLNLNLSEPFQPVPTVSVGGFAPFGIQEWQNALQGAQSTTILDNVTKVISKHTIKAGFMFRRSSIWYNGGWGEQLSFGGGLSSDPVTGLGGTGLAQFLQGATDQYGSYSGTYLESRLLMNYWGFFLEDDYRVSPKLSVNIGLRYDLIPYAFNHERHNLVANFNPHAMNPLVPFLGRVEYAETPQHPGNTLVPIHKNDLAPRFSFAWTPFSNRKTVIRGGFGIIYSSSLEIYQGFGGQPTPNSVYSGYYGDFTGMTPAFQLSAGAPTIPLEDPASLIKSNEQFLGQGINRYALGSKDPYVEQWSLYLQHELPGNLAVSAGYVGTHGLHLLGDLSRATNYVSTATRLQLRENINNPVPVDASLGPIYGCPVAGGQAMCPGNLVLRPFPQYQGITPNLAADGINKYNSFQLKFEKRASHGLSFITAYTIQKNIESANFGSLMGNFSTPALWSQGAGRTGYIAGAASGGLADGYRSATAENRDDRNRYIALSPDDIPQMLNAQVTYDFPVGRGKAFLNRSGVSDKILGGWKLTQNWNFQSGVPMLFSSPCNGISCRPNLIGNPAAGRSQKTRQQKENQWFNPSAFEAPFGSDPATIKGASTGFSSDGTPFDYNSDPWWSFGDIGTRPPSGRMPGYWNSDMALAKDIHISESKYFQFRWEVFNALNHQSLGAPNSNWCLPPNPDGSTDLVHQFGCQFGKITNVQTDPRAMEFGLKFYW